jgi:hypothetical protein
MSGHVYIIRNGELHKIGRSRRLGSRLNKLKPDEVVCTCLVSDPELVESTLHRMFRERRLPQSEYFRLTQIELDQALSILEEHSLDGLAVARAVAQLRLENVDGQYKVRQYSSDSTFLPREVIAAIECSQSDASQYLGRTFSDLGDVMRVWESMRELPGGKILVDGTYTIRKLIESEAIEQRNKR